MKPTSLPVVPAQPDLKTYNFSALDLFVNFSRESYLKKFGQQAPPWKAGEPLKTWFDTSAYPAGPVKYRVIIGTNPPAVEQMSVSDAAARSINLPGKYDYPPYNPPSSTTATTGGQPLNPAILSSYSDALTLATLLNGANPPLPEAVEESPVSWNTETRRIYQVDAPGGNSMRSPPRPCCLYNAGVMLAQMWGPNGIGAPGWWNLTNVSNPVWVPAPAQDQFANGLLPTPVRPLAKNEVIQAGPLGIGYEIVRTDLP